MIFIKMMAIQAQKLIHFYCSILFICFPSMGYTRHHFSPAGSITYIKTTEGSRYTLYSPAIQYTGDMKLGKYRCYIGFSVLIPRWANQDGYHYHNPDFYENYLGSDLFIGISKDTSISGGFTFVPAIGWHQNGIRLRGKSQTLDFYSLTSGLGIQLMTHYQGDLKIPNFLFLSYGFDFMDHLYKVNKLDHGYTATLGFGITL